MRRINTNISTAILLVLIPVYLYGGTVGTIKSMVTNRYVTFAVSHIGIGLYAYGNANADAYTWQTINNYEWNKDNPTYGRAQHRYWHSNKNMASLGLVLWGGALAIDYFMGRLTTKQLAVRATTQVIGANDFWHRTYYYGRYGNQFPDDNSVYANAITIPIINSDIIHGFNEQQAKIFSMLELVIYGTGIIIDPVWR